MPVSSHDKDWMKTRGLWDGFLERRNELRSMGESTAGSNNKAIEELRIKYPDPTTVDEQEAEKVTEALVEGLPERSKPTSMIQWVAANLRGNVNMDTCPGRDAYALHYDCTHNAGFRLDFWKSLYTRVVPSRAQLDGDDLGDELDGAATMEVLDKIGSIGKNREKVEA